MFENIKKVYSTVTSIEDLQQLLSYVEAGEYYAIDTETTGLNTRKDTMIGFSICGEPGIAFYVPIFYWSIKDSKLIEIDYTREYTAKIFRVLLTKKLITFNGSFDLRIIESNYKIDLLPALFSDVMLMKHTIDEEGFFGLKTIAISIKEHLGLDVEKEANEEQIEMKANVAKNGGTTTKNNFEMYKADLDIMSKYAAADADLTLRMSMYFDKRLVEEQLDQFFYDEEVMPLYKDGTILMERKPVKLDIPLMISTREEITKYIEELEKEINNDFSLMSEFQEWVKDFANEDFPVKKTGKFIQLLCEYYNADSLRKGEKYSTAKALVDKLEDGPLKAFLQTEDVSILDSNIVIEIQKKLIKQKNESDYLINISSKNQMADFAFKYLNIKPLSFTDKECKPQFDDAFLQDAEAKGILWAKKIGNFNKLNKMRSTYIDRFLEAQEDGYYYFSYKQHGTISGRFSGDAQQLPRPKEEGQQDPIVLHFTNLIRSFFIAGDNRIFIDCDYESLEPHVFAHVANDDGLKQIFRNGHDFYSTIAIKTEKLQGVSSDKKADNYLGKVNKQARQNAKAYSLGIPYGLGGYALGKTLDISTEEAEKLVEGYLNGFPNLKKWMQDTRILAQSCGYIKSQAGRVRHLPKAKEIYAKYGDKLLDFKFRKSLIRKFMDRDVEGAEKLVIDMYMDYKNSINNSFNFQIQSLGASIVNKAIILINKEFKNRNIDAWVCATIHDQIIANVPENKVDECKEFIQYIMENSTKLSIQLKAPPALGHNWKDSH